MIDQHESQIRTAQRSYLMSQIRRGQLKENAKLTDEALEIWKAAYEESSVIVDECQKQLDEEQKISNTIKEREEEDPDEDANPRLTTMKARLRSALEVQHICIFFIANAYFQLKSGEEPESELYARLEQEETVAYEKAKSIRGQLLAENLRHVNKLIDGVRAGGELTPIPDMKEPDGFSGIESRKLFDKIFHYCEAMNLQAEQFRQLQSRMADFLGQALIDEDEGVELQGDEYESSTKHQDEMYAYMEALRALVADRGEALGGQENMLIKSEMKQFLRAAKEGEGPAPDLMLKLLAEREQKRVIVGRVGCLRGIIAEINQTIGSLQWLEGNGQTRAAHEQAILKHVLRHTRRRPEQGPGRPRARGQPVPRHHEQPAGILPGPAEDFRHGRALRGGQRRPAAV
jgi:E3 ubiquitin-protein ligase SHPRH